MRIRVLIADDHAVVREGLAALIGRQSDMEVVAEAQDGQEAVELWQRHLPDVTLVDLQMPRLTGVGVIEEVRRRDAPARFIVLTTYDTDEGVYQCIRAGAKGYVLKDAARETLLDTVRRVHAGETCLPAQLAAKLAERVSGEELTARESEVLGRLAAGRSNKEIAGDLGISETTVKTHLKSIFGKLNVLSRTEAVAVARKRGLTGF